MSTTSVTYDETCVLALIWTSDVELELFCVGGMSCNLEALCGGIIEDIWDGCSPRTELVIMSPITCFSFDETRWYTATDEADLCPVTAIIWGRMLSVVCINRFITWSHDVPLNDYIEWYFLRICWCFDKPITVFTICHRWVIYVNT